MQTSHLCMAVAAAALACQVQAELTDTFTAGIAAISIDPNAPNPIAGIDFENANILAGASGDIPGFSPVVGGGPTGLFDLWNPPSGFSAITVQAERSLVGDLMTVDVTWATSDGSKIFSNFNPNSFDLGNGTQATHIVLDTGNFFGLGGSLFSSDGIDIGSTWEFVSGTVTATLPDEVDIEPMQWFGDSFLPDGITDIYHAGFIPIQYGFHDISEATSIEYSMTVQIPAPGSLALLGGFVFTRRRRR